MNDDKLKVIFELWVEYLKRSPKYEKYCEQMKQKPPHKENDPAMGINYSIFGDIYSRPLESILSGLEDWNTFFSPIYDYGELISDDIDLCVDHFMKEYNREPAIEELKTFLISRLSDPNKLFLRIDITGGTIEEISDAFVKRLMIYPKETVSKERHKKLFLSPSTRIREDELRRYLIVYDLDRQGLLMREIISQIAPDKDKSDVDVQRAFYRDISNAEKIIENVEKGEFPGNYSK